MISGILKIVSFCRSFFLYYYLAHSWRCACHWQDQDASLTSLYNPLHRRWLNTLIKCRDCSLRARSRASDLANGSVDVYNCEPILHSCAHLQSKMCYTTIYCLLLWRMVAYYRWKKGKNAFWSLQCKIIIKLNLIIFCDISYFSI